VEPLETIEQNNELVRLIEEEQAEIHRIFVALTRQVGTYATGLTDGARVLALVDTMQARARFARDYDCVAPVITPDSFILTPPVIRCSKSAFVLAARAQHSRCSASARAQRRTPPAHHQRPNTGGKTVTLKPLRCLP